MSTLNKSGYGYQIKSPTAETYTICHLFYTDGLRVCAGNPRQLNQLIKIAELFTTNIRIKFGLDKCQTLNIRRGKAVLEGFETGEIIKPMDKTDTYKYLGILQSRQIEQLTTELTTRLQKTFRTYSNSKSLTKAINMYVIPSLIHFSGIILCSQTNLESLEGIIRTKMPKPACTIKALVVKGFNYQKMRVV